MSANLALALALAQRGARVGMVDADILGPSIPGMLGIPTGELPEMTANSRMIPAERYGLKIVSMGMLTIGQYLQPSGGHMPVLRYVHPDVFKTYADAAYQMGFKHVASGSLVRSSYHADEQARAVGIA